MVCLRRNILLKEIHSFLKQPDKTEETSTFGLDEVLTNEEQANERKVKKVIKLNTVPSQLDSNSI